MPHRGPGAGKQQPVEDKQEPRQEHAEDGEIQIPAVAPDVAYHGHREGVVVLEGGLLQGMDVAGQPQEAEQPRGRPVQEVRLVVVVVGIKDHDDRRQGDAPDSGGDGEGNEGALRRRAGGASSTFFGMHDLGHVVGLHVRWQPDLAVLDHLERGGDQHDGQQRHVELLVENDVLVSVLEKVGHVEDDDIHDRNRAFQRAQHVEGQDRPHQKRQQRTLPDQAVREIVPQPAGGKHEAPDDLEEQFHAEGKQARPQAHLQLVVGGHVLPVQELPDEFEGSRGFRENEKDGDIDQGKAQEKVPHLRRRARGSGTRPGRPAAPGDVPRQQEIDQARADEQHGRGVEGLQGARVTGHQVDDRQEDHEKGHADQEELEAGDGEKTRPWPLPPQPLDTIHPCHPDLPNLRDNFPSTGPRATGEGVPQGVACSGRRGFTARAASSQSCSRGGRRFFNASTRQGKTYPAPWHAARDFGMAKGIPA